MAEIVTAQSGPWGSTSTWVGGVLPQDGDDVRILGHAVSLNVNTATLGSLSIEKVSTTGGSLTDTVLAAHTLTCSGQVTMNEDTAMTKIQFGNIVTSGGPGTIHFNGCEVALLDMTGNVDIVCDATNAFTSIGFEASSVSVTGGTVGSVIDLDGGATYDGILNNVTVTSQIAVTSGAATLTCNSCTIQIINSTGPDITLNSCTLLGDVTLSAGELDVADSDLSVSFIKLQSGDLIASNSSLGTPDGGTVTVLSGAVNIDTCTTGEIDVSSGTVTIIDSTTGTLGLISPDDITLTNLNVTGDVLAQGASSVTVTTCTISGGLLVQNVGVNSSGNVIGGNTTLTQNSVTNHFNNDHLNGGLNVVATNAVVDSNGRSYLRISLALADNSSLTGAWDIAKGTAVTVGADNVIGDDDTINHYETATWASSTVFHGFNNFYANQNFGGGPGTGTDATFRIEGASVRLSNMGSGYSISYAGPQAINNIIGLGL